MKRHRGQLARLLPLLTIALLLGGLVPAAPAAAQVPSSDALRGSISYLWSYEADNGEDWVRFTDRQSWTLRPETTQLIAVWEDGTRVYYVDADWSLTFDYASVDVRPCPNGETIRRTQTARAGGRPAGIEVHVRGNGTTWSATYGTVGPAGRDLNTATVTDVSVRTACNGGQSTSTSTWTHVEAFGATEGQRDPANPHRFASIDTPPTFPGSHVTITTDITRVPCGLPGSTGSACLKITELALKDIDNTTLTHFSGAFHTYFSGKTRVHGTITITGDKADAVTGVELEIVQDGAVKAVGGLSSGAKNTLIKPLGTAGKRAITSNTLLFEVLSTELAKIDDSADDSLTLRVTATSRLGQTATREFGAVDLLTRYTGTNRYGQRDTNRGGDDWVKPSVVPVIRHYADILVGDISNMNGGAFPPHATHRTGQDVDAWFTGYNARNAAVAARLIAMLNDDTYGSRIESIYVTFSQTATNPFWNAIRDVTLDDGRPARNVIRPVAGHHTHFHLVISTEE